MTLGRVGCFLAFVALLSVLAIFFFPAMQGPYSVVNGPVTALLSARAAAGVRTAIVQARLYALNVWFCAAFVATSWAFLVLISLWDSRFLPERASVLRC
jgi:hypothetical protein